MTVPDDRARRDDRYAGMTRDEAWADYFHRNPDVLANWGHQNGRWPNDDVITNVLVPTHGS